MKTILLLGSILLGGMAFGQNSEVNFQNLKKSYSIDLSRTADEKEFDNQVHSNFIGANGSLFEFIKDEKVYSDRYGDYQVYVFRLSIVESSQTEYAQLFGVFRRYSDQTTGKLWSEMNGCGYTFVESSNSWSIAANGEDNAACLGGKQFLNVLDTPFKSSK